MANPIVNSITGYVEQQKSDLLAKSVLGGKTIDRFSLMVGVKGVTTLNLLTTTAVVQDGSGCSFTPSGEQTISQRTIQPVPLKVNMEYCPDNFIGTYAAYMVKFGAGKETLPYEQKFVDGVIDSVNSHNERMIFQGDGTNNDNECDGLITILGTSGSGVKTFTKGSTIWASLKAAYAAMPEEVILRDDAEIYISPANYRAFVQELVAANLFHYNENDKNQYILLPGTNLKVVNTPGLSGSNKLIGTYASNIVVGVDQQSDSEEFKMWFSDDNDTFRLKIKYLMGVQVAFPDQVVFGDVK